VIASKNNHPFLQLLKNTIALAFGNIFFIGKNAQRNHGFIFK